MNLFIEASWLRKLKLNIRSQLIKMLFVFLLTINMVVWKKKFYLIQFNHAKHGSKCRDRYHAVDLPPFGANVY